MMPRTGNSATGYALRSIPRARNAQQRLNRRISQTGNSLHLSTVAKSKGSCPSWVKIESAGWVRIQSARTACGLRPLQRGTSALIVEDALISGIPAASGRAGAPRFHGGHGAKLRIGPVREYGARSVPRAQPSNAGQIKAFRSENASKRTLFESEALSPAPAIDAQIPHLGIPFWIRKIENKHVAELVQSARFRSSTTKREAIFRSF